MSIASLRAACPSRFASLLGGWTLPQPPQTAPCVRPTLWLLLLLAAVLQEAAATSEALEAEKAAKFAADAEARELQRMLDEASPACLSLCRPLLLGVWH